MSLSHYTHIVVGAGSAGCCLAARLSEVESNRVLLVEAGGSDWNPMLHIPLASGKLLRRGVHGWKFWTEPDANLGGRTMFWPRGKVLGGSSSINGLVYARGHPSDFDGWAERGNKGWSYREVVPYFERAEGFIGVDGTLGRQGPLGISTAPAANPIYRAFIEAGREIGYSPNDGFNDPDQEGVGRFHVNIVRGRRVSTAKAYLRPALRRRNFELLKNTHVTRILLDEREAVGIEFRSNRRIGEARATREVILAAGVIGSPQILMLSGIGNAPELREVGVAPVHDLRGVGKNLQDHQTLFSRFACPHPVTVHHLARIDRAVRIMLQAIVLRTGPATAFPTEAGAFIRSRDGLIAPDLQFSCSIALGGSRLRVPFQSLWDSDPLAREGFTLMASALRPESIGHMRLRSPEPFAHPKITSNFLAADSDVALMVQALKIARSFADQPSLRSFISSEIVPGEAVQTDEEIEGWLRESVSSGYHPVGTCKMGHDPLAVVDETLRVHGIDKLRVADASIIPTITGANTHATAVMIAEKAADLIAQGAKE